MPAVGIVMDWMQHSSEARRRIPQSLVLTARQGIRSEQDDFSVELLLAGDVAHFHRTHEQHVRAQLGGQVEFHEVEESDDLEVAMPEDRILMRWRDLGLVYADDDTPPPMNYALLRVDETSERRIPRVRPVTIRAFEDEESAMTWARTLAASMTTQ